MTEAERLQKIVTTQEKEIRRLRKLLEVCKVANCEIGVEGNVVSVVVTAIGIDECYFTVQAKAELTKLAEAITSSRVEITDDPPTDSVTGLPLDGGVAPA